MILNIVCTFAQNLYKDGIIKDYRSNALASVSERYGLEKLKE